MLWFTWWLAEEAIALVFSRALAVEGALGVEAGSKRMTELKKTLIDICKKENDGPPVKYNSWTCTTCVVT